ncbi:MAG: thioredoxin family protein [Phycisphaera sp.]|nr:thioredoxin family protein [Phycisphaera sp.]
MPRISSTMIDLGTSCPDFRLPDAAGQEHGLSDAADAPAVLVIFMCNHCPFVKHLADRLAELTREFGEQGLVTFAINSNDSEAHPEDAPAKMAEESQLRGYGFPYLVDEDQSVARSFEAACTPDFFLYDGARRLVYRGQFDETRPGEGEPHGADLECAIEAVLEGRQVPAEQHPSLGCNIKWKSDA